MSVGERHTRLSGNKQNLLGFKNGINSVLVNIETEMQSKFDDINNRLSVIENDIKSSINDQVNESMLNIKDSSINEMKLHETELFLNRLDQYNRINNIEIQGIPSNVADKAVEDKFVNVFKSLNIDIKNYIEGCHRLGKANPKNTIVCFVNRKHAEEALAKKIDLNKIDNANLNFESNVVFFFSENLTPFN